MHEAQWLTCTDPTPMLEFLGSSGKASERKLRLFAAACCRRIWHLLTDEHSERAVEVAERFADGTAEHQELQQAYLTECEATRRSWQWLDEQEEQRAKFYLPLGHEAACSAAAPRMTDEVAQFAGECAAGATGVETRETKLQADLLRCIFGPLPLRPVPPLAPSLLEWHDGAAVNLAQAIYDDRLLPSGHLDAGRLAILADMLEEAGCCDAELLGHLRSAGPHVRGCVAVDVVLGRE